MVHTLCPGLDRGGPDRGTVCSGFAKILWKINLLISLKDILIICNLYNIMIFSKLARLLIATSGKCLFHMCTANYKVVPIRRTASWVGFKWHWKNFQRDLCRVKEHASGAHNIFCLKSWIRNGQQGSLAHSTWIRLVWLSCPAGSFYGL